MGWDAAMMRLWTLYPSAGAAGMALWVEDRGASDIGGVARDFEFLEAVETRTVRVPGWSDASVASILPSGTLNPTGRFVDESGSWWFLNEVRLNPGTVGVEVSISRYGFTGGAPYDIPAERAPDSGFTAPSGWTWRTAGNAAVRTLRVQDVVPQATDRGVDLGWSAFVFQVPPGDAYSFSGGAAGFRASHRPAGGARRPGLLILCNLTDESWVFSPDSPPASPFQLSRDLVNLRVSGQVPTGRGFDTGVRIGDYVVVESA